jgi:hypothetical protein
MVGKRILAGFLSLLVPGLGQMASGRPERGAAILLAGVVIASLQALFLAAYHPSSGPDAAFWSTTLPRIVHDVAAVWAVAFWIWAVHDATRLPGRMADDL